MSNKRKKLREGLLPGLETGGEYSPTNVVKPVVEGGKKEKIRVSGHLKDQQLRYRYPRDSSPQLPLFDKLDENTKRDILRDGTKVEEIVEGIKLSPSEQKVIDCLCKLLHEKSNTSEPDVKGYYSGNMDPAISVHGGENTIAPKLAFSLYELAKEYKGGEDVSGKDMNNVKTVLQELDNRRFLLSYVETSYKKDGSRTERKIEEFKKLITILKLSETEYNKEDVELSKKEETIVVLNPIFRRQIDSKFILYPDDIVRRTIIAYGSHNISETANRLRDYLIRELSSKHYEPEIGLERLYYLLNEKWMKESRKKKVKEFTDKAIETVKAIGLLTRHEIKQGKTGEPKVVFYLNKSWE